MSSHQLLERILDGQSLTESEAAALMHDLADGEMAPALAGALLAGLRAKGETADEIRGFQSHFANVGDLLSPLLVR